MRLRVMADLVAGRGDGAEESGVLGGVFPDQEKCGASPMRGEESEDAGRIGGIGTVIDRQPDLAGGGGETGVDAEQALGVGEEKVVGEQHVGREPEGERGTEGGAADEDGGEFAGEIEGDDEHGGRSERAES